MVRVAFLMQAAWYGHTKIVKALVAAGTDPKLVNHMVAIGAAGGAAGRCRIGSEKCMCQRSLN